MYVCTYSKLQSYTCMCTYIIIAKNRSAWSCTRLHIYLILQVLRNPVDTIATQMAYETFGEMDRSKFKNHVLINHSELLDVKIDDIMCCYEAIHHMQSNPNLNIEIHQLHLADLIRDPYKEMRKLCDFFEVECFDWYLDACAGLVQTKLSKSRNQVIWSKELIRKAEENMRKLPFLSRYSFASED